MNRALLNRPLRLIAVALCLIPLIRSAGALEVVEEIVEQKYPCDPDATLSIRHTDGSVRIYGADVAEISLEAIKKAYTSERLKEIVVDVKATPKGVAIETIVPPNKNTLSLEDRSGTVDYILTVPHALRITKLDLANGEVFVEGLHGGSANAHVANGWLGAHNCFGDQALTIENGRLEVAYDWWRENTKFLVKLSSVNGSIRAIIPSGASIGITARTATGRVANALDSKKDRADEPAHSFDFATEPTPETAFEITSTTGNIRIDKAY